MNIRLSSIFFASNPYFNLSTLNKAEFYFNITSNANKTLIGIN